MTSLPVLELQNVFVLSGVPEHTFVQPVEYTRLLVALRTDGRSQLLFSEFQMQDSRLYRLEKTLLIV